MAPLISFGGIVSGLDTDSIIAAMSAVNKKPIALLEARQSSFDSLRKKYLALQGKVETLREAVKNLATAKDFLAFKAASSNESALTATASGSASAGSFNVTVSSLARAEVDASNGYADFATSVVGTGNLTFNVGGDAHVVTIGSGQDTLEGIRDAINSADIGLKATIVSEGTGATPYRLVLEGGDTGTASAFTVDTTAFSGGFSFAETQSATDAQISVNGLSITRSSNVISDVVPGVTLNLASVSATPVTVTLTADYEDIEKRLQDYVAAHSDFVNFVNAEIKVVNEKGGAFNGESTVRNLKSRLLSAISDAGYPGGSLKSLAQIGVKLQNDGTLTFDAEKFESVAENDLDAVTDLLTKKGKYFANAGFALGASPASLAQGNYAISITQAAAKASVTAGSSFASGGVLGAAEQLTVNQGGKTVVVDLAAGDTLTDAIVKLNDAFGDQDLDLVASDSGGFLKFAAPTSGSALSFNVVSGTASGTTTSGVGDGELDGTGQDAAGTIDGVALVGDGSKLSGADGSAYEGLEFSFTGTAPATTTLTISPDGFFQKLENTLDDMLEFGSGPVALRLEGLADRIDDIDDRIADLELRASKSEDLLRRRFTALEQILGRFQAQQNFLSTFQFPGLTKK